MIREIMPFFPEYAIYMDRLKIVVATEIRKKATHEVRQIKIAQYLWIWNRLYQEFFGMPGIAFSELFFIISTRYGIF